MALDLAAFSEKLGRLCTRLQVDRSDVSNKTGLPVERLDNLFKGAVEPSGDEVLILADYFKCDYNFFISNEKVASFEGVEELFRRHEAELTKEDRWAVQEFVFLCECQDFLIKSMRKGELRRGFVFEKVGNNYKKQGREAALALRRFLGISEQSAPDDIFRDFREMGVNVFRRVLGKSSLSGMCVKHPVAGHCVLVNYSEDVFRQRFTVAHEVAHALLDDNLDCNFCSNGWSGKDLSEYRANEFAAYYLIPIGFIKKKYSGVVWTEKMIIDVSMSIRVNPEVLVISLKSAGLISDSQKIMFGGLKIPKEKKHDPEIQTSLSPRGLERKLMLLKRGLSDSYVSLCFEAYRNGIVTKGRLAEMLLCDDLYDLYDMCSFYGEDLSYGH